VALRDHSLAGLPAFEELSDTIAYVSSKTKVPARIIYIDLFIMTSLSND
jgi:hypothetical protein